MIAKRKAASILRKAAKIVDNGHTKGSYWKYGESGNLCFCATGALVNAIDCNSRSPNHLSVDERILWGKLVDALNVKLYNINRSPHLVYWNDVVASAKEVSSFFRKVASELEHGGSLSGLEG